MRHRPLRAALVAATLLASAAPAFAADGKDPVVAIVNGQEVHLSAVQDAYQNSQFRQAPLDKVYPQVLDGVIMGQIVLEQAKKQHLENDPQVVAALKHTQDRILEQAYLFKRAESEITDADVKARYDQLVKSTPPKEEIHARHILVESEDAAKKVIADLKGGTKFEDEAKAKTKDPSGKDSGGDLGYFSKDEMVPEFSAAAFKLKNGEITQTPVKTQFGWHVIKVEDHRTVPPPSLEEAKPSIQAELKQEKVQKIVEDLQKGADVKRFNADGTPMAAPAEAPAKK